MKRTVLITGATSDIGRAACLRFARAGWKVVCHYRSQGEKASALKSELDKLGAEPVMVKADLSTENGMRGLVKKAAKLNIDTLVNNAGTYEVKKHFNELTPSELKKVFMVNAFTPFFISSALFKRMKEKGFGRIVNISSIAAKYGGSSHSMHYGCSKRALEGVTKTLAREGAGYNVLVNSLRPGVIDTEFHKKFPKNMDKRIAMIPMKQMGTPEAVADLIYYLGSDKNSFVTNETVTIAGGE